MTKSKREIDEVYKMAEELEIKKENLELGLKKDEKNMVDAIKKAHAWKTKKR